MATREVSSVGQRGEVKLVKTKKNDKSKPYWRRERW